MLDIAAVVSGILGGSVVALFAVWARAHAGYQPDPLKAKVEVLRRFAGNRYVLTEGSLGVQSNGEPFTALNEAYIVFAKDREVVEALRAMHRELGLPDRLVDNITTLVKKMAEATNTPIDFNDAFIQRPFTPG